MRCTAVSGVTSLTSGTLWYFPHNILSVYWVYNLQLGALNYNSLNAMVSRSYDVINIFTEYVYIF